MPIYAVHEDVPGPITYIKADNIEMVKAAFPFDYIINEIKVEELLPKGDLASGVTEKGRQMYAMYEKRFGRLY